MSPELRNSHPAPHPQVLSEWRRNSQGQGVTRAISWRSGRTQGTSRLVGGCPPPPDPTLGS